MKQYAKNFLQISNPKPYYTYNRLYIYKVTSRSIYKAHNWY